MWFQPTEPAQFVSSVGFTKHCNPYAGASQEPIDLFESVTPLQLASCVPFIKITKIDSFGRPATDVRPLMYDLVQTPQFGSNADSQSFGLDSDSFIERSLVSLESLNVDYQTNYGMTFFRKVTLNFTVHQPSVVFDRNSKVAWREILEEGKSFALEYGWSADPTVVQNELFNGHGTVTPSGLVIKSTQSILCNIYTYTCELQPNGEVKVTVNALENGDLALRESRFSDAFERTFTVGAAPADDYENIRRLKVLIDGLPKTAIKGRGEFFEIGDILDQVIAPMVIKAATNWGYSGTGQGTSFDIAGTRVTIPPSPATLLLGDFNKDSGPQSEGWGGQAHANGLSQSGIERFLVPVNVFLNTISIHVTHGRPLYLHNFIEQVVNMMNQEGAWATQPPGVTYRVPKIQMKSDTVQNPDGTYRLILIIYDVKTGTDPFHDNDRLSLETQSRADVMARLRSLDVPVLSFLSAGNLISAAAFTLQPDPQFQGIQVDAAYKDRKDRVQQTSLPNVESRAGQARGGELIMPISILEGEITMAGNFIYDAFAILWVDFFGSSEISGIFNITTKSDTLEPGKFTSKIKVVSQANDPLNTQKKRTPEEFSDAAARAKAITGKKPQRR